MKYNRFEELPVWEAAIELAVGVFSFTAHSEFKGFYSLKDQLERAAVSISNNIAEGFERGTTPELLTFLYISRGSAGETRSVLLLIGRLPSFKNFKFEITSGGNLAPTSSVGRFPPKLGHSRPTLFE